MLLRRPGYKLDINAILRACAEYIWEGVLPRKMRATECLVWMAPALQGVCEGLACLVGVQSCVRPVCAVMTAGPDGFRGRGPILLCGLQRPGHYGGLFSPPVRPVRHLFTWSSQPLRAIPR